MGGGGTNNKGLVFKIKAHDKAAKGQIVVGASLSVKTKKVAIFFIGGAADKERYYFQGPYENVKDIFTPFNLKVKYSLTSDEFTCYASYYLDYSEVKGSKDIPNKIESKLDKDTCVYIVGHSLGGWNGAHLSKILTDKGYDVKMLITLDPVGEGFFVWLGSDIYASKPKPKADFWINIRAKVEDDEKQPDDKVADFGEHWEVDKSLPDIYYLSNNHHGAAYNMFRERLNENGSAQDYLLKSIKEVLK